MNQFQISSRARHSRYVFFVDDQYPYEKLIDLICSNQSIWGGRYNPIIPVKQNIISEKYISILKHYDPDYIFYTDKVDPEIIRKLRLFNPCGYYNLDDESRKENISGVNAFYFLSQFDKNSKIILPAELWKTKSILLDYYRINFGLNSNATIFNHEIGQDNPKTIIDINNFDSLHEIIHHEKPINKAHLSRENLNTRILRNLEHIQYNDFEIVIAKDKSTTGDLIYFWNRLLYGGKNILYTTVEELNLLSEDKFFGGVLYDMSSQDIIYVVSLSLDSDEIKEVVETKLKNVAFNRRFTHRKIPDFPFDVLDANGLFTRDYGESPIIQTIISEQGLFNIPKLSFTNKIEYYPQKWVIDIDIKKVGQNYQSQLKFPFTTDSEYIIKGVKGRINKNRGISIIIQNQQTTADTLEINIPKFRTLLHQLISYPIINGEVQNTKYLEIGLHDSSNKLSAFLKSFNFDFSTIDDFFTDKFWVELFEELITSEKIVGDSIEFNEIKSKAIVALKRKGIKLGERTNTFQNEGNLELGLKKTIEELCNYRVFLKGFNLKCKKCSSEFWYHIKEVSETVNCKGCLVDFVLPIEPSFAYKLNDLIKNNIFQSKTNRDGNLTVIRTLVSVHRKSRKSFAYSPQINLYDDFRSNKPYQEIDVVCLSDGQLIIGEAKHNSTAFSADKNKSLKSLAEIAMVIRPDKIILSCYEDKNGKLAKAKQGLIHEFNKWHYLPEIETLVLHQPDDFHVGASRYFYH